MASTRRLASTSRLAVLAAVLAILLTWSSSAMAAGPPREGSGTGQITGVEITPVREVGGNTFEDRVLTAQVEGTLTGEMVQHVSGMVHKNGHVVFSGTITFQGTVDGCGDQEHTVTLGISGKGDVPVPGFPVTQASVRVIDQASNTLSGTGQGTVNQVGPDLSYELRYVCR
jgi:hypothetical protein